MKMKRFISIKTKLILMLTLSASVALLVSSIAIFIYTDNTRKKETIHSLSQLTHIMAHNLIATIEFDDSDSAGEILKTLYLNKDVKGAFIFKNNDINQIFSQYSIKYGNNEKILDEVRDIFKNTDLRKTKEVCINGDIIICRPILIDGSYIATLVMIANTEHLNKILREQLIVQSLVFILVMIFVVLLALKIHKIFTDPLSKMKLAMKDISKNNDLDICLVAEQNDDFKTLFDGFNSMIKTIKKLFMEVEQTKLEIEKIHQHTRESIEYSSLIQMALIPDNKLFNNYFQDYFAIWHPKDTVGGDIYLFEELRHKDECLLMVIDCTGHGVPGAFVTMLVKAIERQIVSNIKHSDEVVSPASLLSVFNKSMKNLLKQEDDKSVSNVGFDGAILYYNKKDKIIKFAGAEVPLFYVEDDKLNFIKGDRYSVGYKKCNPNYKYKEHCIKVKDGMIFYITTDGYLDQNGGKKAFCFGKKRFQNIITSHHSESLDKQQKIFIDELDKYQGDEETTDDMTLVSLRI